MVDPNRLPQAEPQQVSQYHREDRDEPDRRKGLAPIDGQRSGDNDRWIGWDRQAALIQQNTDEYDPQTVGPR